MAMGRLAVRGLLLAPLFATGAAWSQAPERNERPEVFRKLIDCRSLTADAERLACFDARVDALDRAEQARELVVADKSQVRKARRSLFGFPLPKLPLFGDGGDDSAEEFERIETTIQSARQLGNGRWSIVLEDGARWVQTDSKEMGTPARAGDKIAIRRAALGSFFANVNGQLAIRVRREN